MQHPLVPNLPVHLPQEGGSFFPYGDPGEETLYVVAAASPLSQDQVMQEIARAPKEVIQGRDPPPTSTDGKRGFDTVRRVMWGRMDKTGIAVLGFAFRHE
jgi:hypothetical protein